MDKNNNGNRSKCDLKSLIDRELTLVEFNYLESVFKELIKTSSYRFTVNLKDLTDDADILSITQINDVIQNITSELLTRKIEIISETSHEEINFCPSFTVSPTEINVEVKI